MKNFIRYNAVIFIFLAAQMIAAQTTGFNYQGKLTDSGTPQATYQMQFKLFDAAAGGSQIGNTVSNDAVAVSEGVFSILLDFGTNVFTGADRFLEISVRRSASESYITLTPRQQIASSPYSIRTLSAQTADMSLDSQKLGGIAASEYVTNSTVGGTFIRNGTTQQTGNFNISGNGVVGGNFGIGITNPAHRLDIFGGVRSLFNGSTGMLVETTGGTNSWAKFYMKTPNRSWSIGTSQNFNSDQFYLVDETGGQIRMSVSTGGFVGINNTNPQSGLDIRGTGLQVQQRITDNTSGNSLVLQGGAGSNTKVTGFNYNTNTPVPLYLSTDGANTVMNSGGGNVIQPGSGYGMPKAMLYVLANGTMVRCYNGITGATTGNCGFSVSGSNGIYTVTLGFNVTTRFFSVTGAGGASVITRFSNIVANNIAVNISGHDTNNNIIPSDFFLIVY